MHQGGTRPAPSMGSSDLMLRNTEIEVKEDRNRIKKQTSRKDRQGFFLMLKYNINKQ